MAEYKQCSYSLRKAIKQAKRQYRDKVESQFNGLDMRPMWQGLQTITDYKRKTSHVASTDILLSDRLNTFFARFEDSTVPLMRPATKDCGLFFSVSDVSKTFKNVNPQTASLAVSSEHAQTSWLVCLRAYWCIYGHSPYPSLLFPHASKWPPLFLYPRRCHTLICFTCSL